MIKRHCDICKLEMETATDNIFGLWVKFVPRVKWLKEFSLKVRFAARITHRVMYPRDLDVCERCFKKLQEMVKP